MPYSYFRLFLVALLCHQPARPLLRSYIVSSKALLSQLIAAKNGITTGVTIRQRVHAATDPASTLTESPFEASGMSYSSLLVHYLSQNVKPKFGLCLSVMSKIVEHEGPDAAIRTSEFLKCNISAEGFHMANKALLSALVMQRHLEAASSHLRRLLLDQSEHRQVDATVVADLLQLHMAVDIHHNTTKVRRKYKKRAVEASSLYSDILGTQLLSSEEFPHLNGVGVGMDETYGDPTAKLTSGSAINRIHEYGARALAASREWEQAVSAVGRIEDRHLSRPQMVSFCTQLLDRLVALNMPVAPQPLAVQSAAPGEVSSDVSERSVSDTGCDGSAALEFSLSLPLQHMPADSPLLHAALLVMSAFPSHAEAVIALLHGSFSRRSNTHTNTHNTAADGHSHTTFFPEEISLKLTKQLFIGGCSADNLLLAMKMLWGDQLLQSGLENVGSPASHDDGNVSLYGAYDTSETSLQLAVDAVQGVINAACALRDLQGTETDESQKAQISQESVADLPATILRALTPHGTAPDASEGTAPSRGMSSADIDTSSTPPLPIPHTRSRSRPDPLLRALSPSLHCLCIALRLSGQRHRIGAVLQSVGDAYLEAGRQSYLRSGAESSQVNHPDTVPQQGQGQGEGDSAAADDAVWAPSLELMVEVSISIASTDVS